VVASRVARSSSSAFSRIAVILRLVQSTTGPLGPLVLHKCLFGQRSLRLFDQHFKFGLALLQALDHMCRRFREERLIVRLFCRTCKLLPQLRQLLAQSVAFGSDIDLALIEHTYIE